MQGNVDNIAAFLASAATMARSMPPSWDGACISHTIAGNGAGYVGRMLPGKGIYVDLDLSALGIHKPIPGVFERSVVQRAWEQFSRHGLFDERVAIGYAQWCKWRRVEQDEQSQSLAAYQGAINALTTGYDGILNARAGGKGEDIIIAKLSLTTVSLAWSSLAGTGGIPAALTYTAIPGGAVMINTNQGAWSRPLTNPVTTDRKYLLTFGFGAGQQINWLILADLLVAASGVDANIATSQTVNTVAQTRQYGGTLGAGVILNFEITTALGATASNITGTYTNQAGTASRSTGAIAMTTSAIAGRTQPISLGMPITQLQAGDFGVRSLESVIFSAAMLAGVLAAQLYYPLMFIPGVAANAYIERDSTVQIDGLTELKIDGSNVLGCLIAYVLANTSTTGAVNCFMRTVAA